MFKYSELVGCNFVLTRIKFPSINKMNRTIHVSISPTCPTCGSTDNIEFSDDHSYAKCNFCGTEYLGGEEELKEKMLECPEVKKQLEEAAKTEIEKALHKALRSIKGIKFNRK